MWKVNKSLSEFYDDWQTRIKQYKIIKKCLEDYFNSDERINDKPSPKELLDLFRTNPLCREHGINAHGPNYETIYFGMESHKIDEPEDVSIETLDINVYANGYQFLFSIDIHWDDKSTYYVRDFDFDRLDSLSWSEIHDYITRVFYTDYNILGDKE